MSSYRITDPQTGKTVTVSGDTEPTQADAESIFAQAGLRGSSQSSPQTGSTVAALGLPSIMDRLVSSPVGRAVQQNVVQPAFGLASVLPFDPVGTIQHAFGKPSFIDEAGQDEQNAYQSALARNRNTPGYDTARAKADLAQNNISPSTGALFPSLTSPVAGAVGLFGGLDASNAAADAAQAQQDKFSNDNPKTSIALGLLGGLAAMPLKASDAVAFSGKAAIDPIVGAAQKMARERMGFDVQGGGPTPQDIKIALERAQQLGLPMTIADYAGEGIQGRLEGLANKPGPARSIIATALKNRQEGAHSQAMDTIAQYISPEMSSYNTANALTEARVKAAAPLYQDAFAANPGVASPKLDRLLETPAGKAALSGARTRIQNQMSLMGTPDPELTEQAKEAGQYVPGQGGVASGLKLKTWDIVKQELDDIIGATKRQVANGNARQGELRDLVSIKNNLVNELDRLDTTAAAGPNSLKPEGGLYKQARAAYAGPSASMDAMDLGASIFKKSPEEITDDVASLSPSNKSFYNIGLANAIKDRVLSAGDSANVGRTLAKNPLMKARMEAAIGDPDAAKNYLDALDTLSTAHTTKYNLLGNSRTGIRNAENASKSVFSPIDIAETGLGLATGHPLGTLFGGGRLAKTALETYLPSLLKIPQKEAEFSRMMLNTDPQANDALLDLLSRPKSKGRGYEIPQRIPNIPIGMLPGALNANANFQPQRP